MPAVPFLAGQCGYVNNKVRSAFAAFFVRNPLRASFRPSFDTGGRERREREKEIHIGLPSRVGQRIYTHAYAHTRTRVHVRARGIRDSTVAARWPRRIIYRPARGILL